MSHMTLFFHTKIIIKKKREFSVSIYSGEPAACLDWLSAHLPDLQPSVQRGYWAPDCNSKTRVSTENLHCSAWSRETLRARAPSSACKYLYSLMLGVRSNFMSLIAFFNFSQKYPTRILLLNTCAISLGLSEQGLLLGAGTLLLLPPLCTLNIPVSATDTVKCIENSTPPITSDQRRLWYLQTACTWIWTCDCLCKVRRRCLYAPINIKATSDRFAHIYPSEQ